MSITCVPVHGNAPISPTPPVPVTSMALIHLRPYSPAKNRPLNACGNFTGELRFGSNRYTGPAIGDSDPVPNSGGVPASPPYLIHEALGTGSFLMPVLRGELLVGPPAQSNFAPEGP